MPVYNSIEYLTNAIDSVLRQTFANFEFIIIDDASTDGSLALLRNFRDDRILLVENETNRGYIFGLNYGLSIARGEFIARMDSDDYSYPERFEQQIDFLRMNPDVGVCGSFVRYIGSGSGFWKPQICDYEIKAGLINGSTFCHPAVMMRKEVLKLNSIKYSVEYYLAEDYYMWFQLSQYTKFYNIPNVLLDYRISNSQVSTKYKAVQMSLKRKIRIEILSSVGLLQGIDVRSYWNDDLSSKDLFLFIETLRASNLKSFKFDQKSFTKELSYMLLDEIDGKTMKLGLLVTIFKSVYCKYWSLRMKIGLCKRFLLKIIHT